MQARDVFVGREPERAELTWAWDEASSGHGRLVVVSGEPGIGKARLAEELAGHVRGRRGAVLWGSCCEGASEPFWPWAQVVRAALAAGRLDPSALGDVRTVVPDVGLPALARPADAAQSRDAVFSAFAGQLRQLSAMTAALVVLDDVQWADPDSLQLLAYVARDLPASGLIVVAIHREGELPADHPRVQATVERHVPYVRDSFFAGRAEEVASLAAMQVDALRWCLQVANQRRCRPLERVAPQAAFDAGPD